MDWFSSLIPADPAALALLDAALYALHLIVVAFVLTGWAFAHTRRLHHIVIVVVWLSWLGLGLYVGDLGYCVLTDWHWQVKRALGQTGLPPSFLEYLYRQMTGRDVADMVVSWFAAITLIAATVASFVHMPPKTRLWIEFFFFYGGAGLLIFFVRQRMMMVGLMWGGALAAYGWLKGRYAVTHVDDWNFRAVKPGVKEVLIRFAWIAPMLFLFTWLYDPERLFSFPRERPGVWVMVMLFYPILSVWPQEILFRSFLFHRYRPIFPPKLYPFVSAIAFGFVHIVFSNWIAVVFSAAGGYMFARTYAKHRSLALVCLEHALYGCTVFTLGLGYYFFTTAWMPRP